MRGYLGLGSNLGDPFKELLGAVSLLTENGVTIVERSSLYRTEPVDVAGSWFLNAVVRFEYEGTPSELLELCLSIERSRGRERGETYTPREIDIDILLIDGRMIDTDALTVPHPRIAERKFVLVPLAEIAASVRHPVHGRTIGELLDASRDPAEVHRLQEAWT